MSRSQEGVSPPHWAAMGEQTFVLGVWLLYAVHCVAGRWGFRCLVAPVVLFHWVTRPVLRAASLQYLRRLHAAEPGAFARAPGWAAGLRHVGCFAETLLDKLLAMAGRYPLSRVSESGVAIPDRWLREGRGGMFVTAHMGCLELCRAFARHKAPLRLTVLVHTQHAEAFNRILQRLDPQSTVNLMQVSEVGPATAAHLQRIVDGGGWVAIAGDRVPIQSQQTTPVQFLGHEARLPVGPYVLAHLLRCPLLLLACTHEGHGYRLHFETLAERVDLPRAQRAEGLQQHAQHYADALQRLLRRAPYDWFNFFHFWDQGRA